MVGNDRPTPPLDVSRSDGDDPFGALPPGTQVGKYSIAEMLGQGGFGITYRAHDSQLHRDVALKEYLPTSYARRQGSSTVVPRSTHVAEDFIWGRERFLDEARTLARLEDAPGIVNVHDFLEANGTAYMAMTLVRGETLEARLKRDRRLRQPAIEQILYPLLDGLEMVHDAGFLHRDIKPANILIDSAGRPTLIDFGASRVALLGRTQAMTAVYTPGYAAPEQMTSAKQGPWTDIYAVSGTLYHCIAGRTPASAMERVTGDALIPASEAGKGRYAPSLLAAIDAGLKLKAAERPQTIADWRRVLDGLSLSVGEVPTGPATREMDDPTRRMEESATRHVAAGRRRRRLGWVAAGIVALTVTGASGWMMMRQQPETAEQMLRRAEAEAQRHTDLVAKLRQEEEARQRAAAEIARKAEQEAARRAAEEKEATEAAARRQTEEAERQRAVAAEARRKADEDVARKAAEEKATAEAVAKRMAEEEAAARSAAEAVRRRAEDQARAEQEARHRAEQETAARKAAEEKAEAETRRKAEAQAAARKAAEEKAAADVVARRKAEEEATARIAAEARRKADDEVAARAAADAARRRAEEQARVEAEAKRKAEQEATARKAEEKTAAEVEAKHKAEEEARRAAEEKARTEAAAREKAEADARAEAEAKRRAEEDAARKATEDKTKSEADARRQAEAAEAALRLGERDRKHVQVALTSQGHDTRGTDGAFGPRTRQMVTAWQKKQGAPETGYLTAPQLAALRQQAAPALARFDEEQKKLDEDKRKAEEEAKRKADEEARRRAEQTVKPAPAPQAPPAAVTPPPPSVAAAPSSPGGGATDGLWFGAVDCPGYRRGSIQVQMTGGRGTATAGDVQVTISIQGDRGTARVRFTGSSEALGDLSGGLRGRGFFAQGQVRAAGMGTASYSCTMTLVAP